MSNVTACPNCGAPFTGGNIAGDYRCKFCGNVFKVDAAGVSTSKPSNEFYQPDPPQSMDTYQESVKKGSPSASAAPSPIPQEVINKLDETRTFLGLARKWGTLLLLGIVAFCALCITVAFLVFRTGK